MKVGILTFPHAPSLGAMLQMGALYHVIEEMGHDVAVINYVSDKVNHKKTRTITPKTILIEMLSKCFLKSAKPSYQEFEQKLDELKQQKKSLMDAGLALDSSNLDSAVQATLMESINDSLRDVENKAYDVSKDANQNLQSLEQIRQNVDDEITDSQKAKKKLDQTKKLLDTLGVGKSLEKGVNKLDDHLQEATGLKGEVISAMQDLEKVYRQLDQI